ncbi:MAG TPA: NepR family anti-sigma factor [Sphingomicrobium sp.]|nr:NepR family anti-sigma factor [Sphingomicrobium sp.]
MSEKKVGEAGGAEVTGNGSGTRPPAKKRKKRAGDVGRALRSVYDETLREDVPDDFLDLLGKLS